MHVLLPFVCDCAHVSRQSSFVLHVLKVVSWDVASAAGLAHADACVASGEQRPFSRAPK